MADRRTRRPSSSRKPARPARDVAALRRELAEALERERATREILRLIAGPATNLQSVLDAVAERAARLCEATDAQIFRLDGEALRLAAHHGRVPSPAVGDAVRLSCGSVTGRAVVDRQTVHVADLAAEPETGVPGR